MRAADDACNEYMEVLGNPDLGLERVLGSTEKGFDTHMLLYPFEEQLDLPTATIDIGDGPSRRFDLVGQESLCFARIVLDADSSK